jgi:hypothetical protein
VKSGRFRLWGDERFSPIALLIAVVPFVVRNRGYQWGQRRLMVLGVRLFLLVEADCGGDVFPHNPSGRGFERARP